VTNEHRPPCDWCVAGIRLISDPPGVKPRLRPVDGDYTVPDGRTFNLCREHHDQAVVLYADPERDRQRTAARWENRHPTAVTAILWIVMPIEYAVIAAFWLGPPIVTVRFFSQLPVGYGIAAALWVGIFFAPFVYLAIGIWRRGRR
jgi:hypothetical protein